MEIHLDGDDPASVVGAGWARELITRRVHDNDPASDLITEIFSGDLAEQAATVASLVYLASVLVNTIAELEGIPPAAVVQTAFVALPDERF